MTALPGVTLPAGTATTSYDVRGGPLAVVDLAPAAPTRGTVVLVPGFTGSKEDFRLVLGPLAAAGLRAVSYDQRGQYQSPGPADPAAYAVDELAADLRELLRRLGDGPVHLVGHSFGGLVARAAVLQDRAVARSLVLMGSGPAGLVGPRTEAMQFLRPVLEQGGLLAVWEGMQALPARETEPVLPEAELQEFLRTRMLAGSPTGLLATGDALLDEPDRVEQLAARGVRTLVLHGVDDDAWPPALQHQMARRLAAEYVVVPGALHSPAVENPEATVEALLAFFAQVD